MEESMKVLLLASISALLIDSLGVSALAAPPEAANRMLTRFGFLRFAQPVSTANSSARIRQRTKSAKAVPPATYTIVDAPGAGTALNQGTVTYAVNTSSTSSGWYRDSSYNYHGFLRAPEGSFQSFDADGPNSQTQPDWMNNKGAVVGKSRENCSCCRDKIGRAHV